MKKDKRQLYLDSDIIVRTGILLKLLTSGGDKITIQELSSFNKSFANKIVKELGYTGFYYTPSHMLHEALIRFCYYNSKTGEYTLNPDTLNMLFSSIEDYRKEYSSNKMYMSVFDEMIREFASKIKNKQLFVLQNKLNNYYQENYKCEDEATKFSTSLSNRELAGRMILIYFELYYEKKLGLNFEITLPSESELDDQYERLQIQEKSYNRLFGDEDLLPGDLATIAKVIREKKFTIAKYNFLLKRMQTMSKDNINPKSVKEQNTKKNTSVLINEFIEKFEDSMKSVEESMDKISKIK